MKKFIAGVDEVGRGSLVGPVFAATVVFKRKIDKKKIKDSKKISKKKRNILEKYIKTNSIWSIGSASLEEIEKLNILNASLLAMKRSIKKLRIKPSIILIDGNKSPDINGYKLKSIIKGDQKISEISAASIIAKVARDRLISKISKKFKNYSWDKNAGYGTKQHIKAIKKFGITKHHRKTFNPIHNILSLN
jgi:ribonuclease HII|tara:strand:- start:7744 stop:8316 length:573 start_codon:yes stop_codon:yes gene_type:complete